LNWSPPPEPCESQLLEQLRTLNGVPAEVADNPDLMRLAWPAIRADTALYRNYVYQPEPALPIPIFAYGGDSDPNVALEQAEAWREQTTARFTSRQFPGGHFFIQSQRESFLKALLEDLRSLS